MLSNKYIKNKTIKIWGATKSQLGARRGQASAPCFSQSDPTREPCAMELVPVSLQLVRGSVRRQPLLRVLPPPPRCGPCGPDSTEHARPAEWASSAESPRQPPQRRDPLRFLQSDIGNSLRSLLWYIFV
jgi:hypothetical protein